jgi:hypothetical protein
MTSVPAEPGEYVPEPESYVVTVWACAEAIARKTEQSKRIGRESFARENAVSSRRNPALAMELLKKSKNTL